MISQKGIKDRTRDEMERLVALAAVQPTWRLLDVSAGDRRIAERFKSLVAEVVTVDLKSTPNVTRALPYPDASFEVITCWMATHQLEDCFRLVSECARLLRPGGCLLVQDVTVPDEPRAARFINAFERLHNPRHQRGYARYEWEGMLLDSGLAVDHVELLTVPALNLLAWAEAAGASDHAIERLHILLRQAPPAVREWLRPHASGTPDAHFDHHEIIVKGRKPG
jgi:SAM-dependent methyltransferase